MRNTNFLKDTEDTFVPKQIRSSQITPSHPNVIFSHILVQLEDLQSGYATAAKDKFLRNKKRRFLF